MERTISDLIELDSEFEDTISYQVNIDDAVFTTPEEIEYEYITVSGDLCELEDQEFLKEYFDLHY